jgi:hypothetical protein
LKSLVDYWRNKYDWRTQERRLNTFDQFKTTIDGVDVHFIHQRSKQPNALPLLMLNGWPSSIVESLPSSRPTTTNRKASFASFVLPSRTSEAAF